MARDAEEGPRGSTSNWSNQRFGHHRRCTRISSNASRGREDCIGNDVPHVLPRFFHCNALPFHLQRQVFFLWFFACFIRFFELYKLCLKSASMRLWMAPSFRSRRAVSNGGLLLSVAYDFTCFMKFLVL